MKTTYIHLTLLLIAIFLFACKNEDVKNPSLQEKPLDVKILEIKEEASPHSLKVSGIVHASQQASISSKLMAVVEQINVSVGERVKKGDLLISLSSSDIEAQKRMAIARLNAAESEFKTVAEDLRRAENLITSESISRQEFEKIQNTYNAAKANLEASKQMQSEIEAYLSYAKIRAPFDGEIVNQFIEVGDMAKSGQTLLGIEQSNSFEVRAGIPEQYIAEIIEDTLLTVSIQSIEQQLQGRLFEVSRSSASTGGQFMVKIQLTEAKQAIYSGMFAEIELPLKEGATIEKSIYIPETTLIRKGGMRGVYTLSESNTALLRWLKLGEKKGEKYEVLSGLSNGEKILLVNSEKIYNGASVNVIQ